jgi:hypothetical protein
MLLYPRQYSQATARSSTSGARVTHATRRVIFKHAARNVNRLISAVTIPSMKV